MGQTKGGDGFIDAARDILQTLTADTRSNAQQAAIELVSAIDGCQHSTQAQLANMLDLLLKTQAAVTVNRDLLNDSRAEIGECLDIQSTAQQSLNETTRAAGETLHIVETSKNPTDEIRTRYVNEMNKRNAEFEDRLRADHEEFRRMHARRLASVFQ